MTLIPNGAGNMERCMGKRLLQKSFVLILNILLITCSDKILRT